MPGSMPAALLGTSISSVAPPPPAGQAVCHLPASRLPLGLGLGLGVGAGGSGHAGSSSSSLAHRRTFFSFPSPDEMRREFMSPDRAATSAAIIANVGVYAATAVNRRLFMALVQHNGLVHAGEWWRLATAPFCHGSLLHLAGNMLAVHWLGPQLEHVAGRTMFVAVYAGGALGGGLAHLWLTSGGSYVLGSSGAIAGLFAGFVVYKLRNRHHVGWTQHDTQWVLQMVAINALLGVALSGQLAHMAHIGGLVGGAAAMFLLGPRYVWVGGRVEDRPLLPLFRGWP